MPKFAPVFKYEGSQLISPFFYGTTREEACSGPEGQTPAEFADKSGFVWDAEAPLFEFVDGAAIPNRIVAVFPKGSAEHLLMMCVGGPLLEAPVSTLPKEIVE